MREFLTSGQVGNIELNAQKKIREDIQNRWEQLGFVEGLEGNIKENIATLYENEAKHLISEATASDNSGSFETVVFPIIRRVFSKLLANENAELVNELGIKQAPTLVVVKDGNVSKFNGVSDIKKYLGV